MCVRACTILGMYENTITNDHFMLRIHGLDDYFMNGINACLDFSLYISICLSICVFLSCPFLSLSVYLSLSFFLNHSFILFFQIPISSDNARARRLVSELVRNMGLHPVDFGALRAAREIEEIPFSFFREWKVAGYVALLVFFLFYLLLFMRWVGVIFSVSLVLLYVLSISLSFRGDSYPYYLGGSRNCISYP